MYKGKPQTIHLDTFKRIKKYLEEQEKFIYKSKIFYDLRLSSYAIDIALNELESEGILERNDANQVKLKKVENVS